MGLPSKSGTSEAWAGEAGLASPIPLTRSRDRGAVSRDHHGDALMGSWSSSGAVDPDSPSSKKTTVGEIQIKHQT